MDGNRGNEGRPITIYDIAKEANVSAATVSRVLTNSTKVRKDKRERILGLMEKYNFRPNAMARGLADTRSKTIGIMVADVRNPFYSEAFVACEAAAARRGYTVLLCNSYCDKEQEKILLGKLAEKRVDAIIQMGGRADELCTNAEYAEYVNRMIQNIPMLVTGKLDGTDCYQLQINAPESMELIMDYLAELGHEKIAFLGGFDNVLSTNEKEAVYRKKLAERGISLPEQLYRQEGNYDFIPSRSQGISFISDEMAAVGWKAVMRCMISATWVGVQEPSLIVLPAWSKSRACRSIFSVCFSSIAASFAARNPVSFREILFLVR